MFGYLAQHIWDDFLAPLHAAISKWKVRLISPPLLKWLIIYGIGRCCSFSYLCGGCLSPSTELGSNSTCTQLHVPTWGYHYNLFFFLSGVNGVQGEAYHMCRSVQLNNVNKSDLEDKLSWVEVSLTPLWEKERMPPQCRRWKKMIFE